MPAHRVLNRRALGLSNGHNQDDFSDDEGGDNPYSKNFSNVLQQASERRTSGNNNFNHPLLLPLIESQISSFVPFIRKLDVCQRRL